MGRQGGVGPFGTYDMAGNVKEWCWNETSAGRRYTLGGGWNETDYMFQEPDAVSPFDRQATFGFRCMIEPEPVPSQLTGMIATLERNASVIQLVDPDLYEAYRRLYAYDPRPLDARLEREDDTNPAWRFQRVSIRAAYGDGRFSICLFLPSKATPPFQSVIFFPGVGAVRSTSSQSLGLEFSDFFPKSGRALVYPIYQGTYERRVLGPGGPNEQRDFLLPYATAQLPLYNALGSADKRQVVFEGGHIPPHPHEAIKTILEWMDARMGPVR